MLLINHFYSLHYLLLPTLAGSGSVFFNPVSLSIFQGQLIDSSRCIFSFSLLILLFIASTFFLVFLMKRRINKKNKEIEKEKSMREGLERKMEISEKAKAMILNSVSDLILYISPESNVKWANQHFFKAFNKRPEDVKGKPFQEVLEMVNDVSLPGIHVNEQKLRTLHSEYIHQETQKVFRTVINPVINDNNQCEGFVKIMTDITLQKHVESQLMYAKEKAEEADTLKSAFMANMSHEIRTPMNAIVGFAELLETGGFSAREVSDFLQIIKSNGHQLLRLINDIMVFSQLETGQLQVNRESLKPEALMNELYFQFSEELKRVDRSSIELKIKTNLTLDDEIYADGVRLRQVLYNLVSNAIKFTGSGSITIGCKAVAEQYIFFVKDTGPGIPAEKKKLVFKRFEQLDNISHKGKPGGVGLGLSICRELVYLMGGRIWVNSTVGKGSTFIFKLPK